MKKLCAFTIDTYTKRMFVRGLRDGLPIGLGYLAVSFALGIAARRAGLGVLAAAVMSLTNLTSAGQAAGITLIAAGTTVAEMALTQLVINLRYLLMSCALSQKVAPQTPWYHRMLVSFGITDELFALQTARPGETLCLLCLRCPVYGRSRVDTGYRVGRMCRESITRHAHRRTGCLFIWYVCRSGGPFRQKRPPCDALRTVRHGFQRTLHLSATTLLSLGRTENLFGDGCCFISRGTVFSGTGKQRKSLRRHGPNKRRGNICRNIRPYICTSSII